MSFNPSLLHPDRARLIVAVLLGMSLGANQATAQTVPPDAILMPDARIENAEAARLGHQLYLSPQKLQTADSAGGQLKLPRLASSLTAMQWLGHAEGDSLSLKIEQDHWIVAWKQRPADSQVIVLSFDAPPKLMSEIKPTAPAGDGSVYLQASQASTSGEKIRYEPQTFKNTVGYWAGKQDLAEWQFEVGKAGTYNVAILQGCGQGQGGSRARLSVSAGDKNARQKAGSQTELEFDVVETGGFQNFRWRHLGQIVVTEAGLHTLQVAPIEIKKNALMDVRAIHLIPVPQG